MTREEAIANYRATRNEWMRLCKLEDAAFLRYFRKLEAGERTNGAATSRLGNLANYASAEMYSAQGVLFGLDIDPWDVDDEDGVERTPIGGNAYS